MFKKLIYLTSFVLVLGLISDASANLVGHWKFDEGSGTTATDSSGYDNHGTITDAEWVTGFIGGAVNINAVGHVDVPAEVWSSIEGQATIAFWAYGDPGAQPQANFTFGAWQDPANNEARVMSAHVPWSDGTVYFDTGGTNAGGYDRISKAATAEEYEGAWRHWAFTKNADTGEQKIYLNGVLWHSGTDMTRTMTGVTAFTIGDRPAHDNSYAGMIDDFRLYNRSLSEAQVQDLFNGISPTWVKAEKPDPADGASLADTWVNLGWSPGDYAVSHDVYLGDNFDDVNDGTGDTFRGNQAVTNLIIGFLGFPYPDGLVPGTTYYWRIDEVNDTDPNSPWKGNVWSFWIPPRTAYDPEPADGVKFVKPDVELSWTAGFNAKLHYVFFGDNFDDVNNAVVGLPQSDTTYTPGTLELDKVYYWRIDEFDAVVTHKGDVWSFKTLPFVPITDPNLIAWWKLDEGSGNTALDGSGHNHHGTIGGTPDFVPGYNGDALDFDGSTDYIDVDGQLVSGTFSLTMWIRPRDIPYSSGYYAVMHNDAWNAGSLHVHLRNTTSIINADINSGPGVESTTVLQADQWYHCALTVTTAGGNASKLYINGVLENTGSGGTGTPYLGPMIFGAWDGGTTRHYHGLMDDIRIYDKVLTVEEIMLAMRGDPLLAWEPKPTHGSTVYIRDATPLNWSAGDNASQHDVYFGTDRDAVADANATDTTGIYRGRQAVTIYTPAEGVEWGGGPYYWRIDEYNTDATISTGNVWIFTVADFIEIDDIEDYNDYPPDEIFSTWIDGWEVPTNGSLAGHADPPFAETGNVHGGSQSMPVYYENNFKYSEITMTLVSVRDWTEEGVGVLSLWFYGDASNAAERMYVALNGSAVVYHNDSSAALIDTWTEWTIDLQEFAAQGVNLANVNTISIGFGDKNNLQAGGSGMVLFDDIRLYRPAPEPEPAP